MGDLYLYYGDDEAAVNEAKIRLIQQLMPPEQREHNLSEFTPPANRFTLSLRQIMADLIAELSTASLFKDSFRLTVVYNLDAFYQESEEEKVKTKAPKKSPVDSFIDFLQHKFLKRSNVLIFVCLENPDKGRWVSATSPLLAFIKSHGYVSAFRSQLRQNFIDSILARDGFQAVKDFRRWWARTKSPVPVFNALLSTIELLLQAKLVSDRKRYLLAEQELKEKFLKRSMTVSIFKEYPSRQQRFLKAAESFSLRHLLTAMEKLLELNIYVFPQQSDRYVPDIQPFLETFILNFTAEED